MKFDVNYQPYPSNRYPVIANRGMVCTGSNLASAAGLEILRQGGNAVDAAIATAAALSVVEPTANGIGGDAFAIVWFKDKIQGLNSTGCSPENISIEKVKEKDGASDTMPTYGWTPVNVPGEPKAWAALSERYGKLPLTKVLAPAIDYAENGYPVGPSLSRMWKRALNKFKLLKMDKKPEFKEWFNTFTIEGRAPEPGEIMKLPNHGKTLRIIAETKAEAFYHGVLGVKIEEESKKYGGFIRKSDLEAHEAMWVDPISVNYRGYDIWEIPPNGQGIVALMALNILKEFKFESRNVDTFHKQFEAIKIAFADGLNYVTDPSFMNVEDKDLINPAYGQKRSKEIDEYAKEPKADIPPKSGTVYLCTADGEGNMVSYIQSNYMGFGSGIVVEGTGIALQNRGHDFSLDPCHINALAPKKRTYHTIIPGFITKDNKAIGPFGVMGGRMQPQGHVQVAMNMIDFHLNPQMALDAPRWQWMKEKEFIVEQSFDPAITRSLIEKGHKVTVEIESAMFGRGQCIVKLDNGTLVGGCESRTDSNISCW